MRFYSGSFATDSNTQDPEVALRRFRSIPKSTQKKIAWVGDSTMSQPFVIVYSGSDHYIDPGLAPNSWITKFLGTFLNSPFYNCYHYNFALNGQKLQNFVNDATTGATMADIAAVTPDLILFSYGINDRRLNERSKEEIKADLQAAIVKMRGAAPQADIVMIMPNSLIYDSANSPVYIDAPVSQTKVQGYSADLRDAYRELVLPDHVYMMDVQSGPYKLFSENVNTLALKGGMNGDALHPSNTGHLIRFCYIGAVISGNYNAASMLLSFSNRKAIVPAPYSELQCDRAYGISATDARKYYPRILENPKYYNVLFDGQYEGTAGTNITVSKNINSIEAKNYVGIFAANDVVLQYGVTATTGGTQGEQIEEGFAAWAISGGGKNESGNHFQWFGLSGGYPLAGAAFLPMKICRVRPTNQKNDYDPNIAIAMAAADFTMSTWTHVVQRAGAIGVITYESATGPGTGSTIDLKKNGTTFATITVANGATTGTLSGTFVGSNTKGIWLDEGDIVTAVVNAGFVAGTFPKIRLSNH